ncbi:hypothetical protein BGW36DRAFT_362846 [Talaromyces proteolyticus]|uniref:Uncharacterized protein n=1 Tax=Talaromyces proteolyticus TaxID=1131652 RepID=A0AAD4KIB3_9EURO|nr:uncharacterized protein BGW36DRAFT_362846 [Talaromyces proteolyticus]KAH8691809.1 hypothetical protein BGW36DRAFT_362846 [Talaromyces proteolyticus]
MLKTLTNPDLPKHAQVLRYVLGLWVKPAVNESGFDLHIRDPDSGHEDECLKHAIQQLSNLTTLILDFGLGNRTASQRNNREIARKRRVTTSQSSRLRAALSALSSSEDLLTNMEMRSYNYGPVDDDLKSINFTGNALSKITSLSLYDCFTWYNRTFPHLNIPSLRSLYLRHTAVRVPILEDFTQRHRKTLRSLKMEKFWLTWRENDSKPQDIFTTEKLLAFERIAKLDILKTVRLRRVLQSFRKLVSPDYTLCFFP